MTRNSLLRAAAGSLFLLVAFDSAPRAEVHVQCPGDLDGDAIPDKQYKNGPSKGQGNPAFRSGVQCKHLTAGDGFITMADGRDLYMFGFGDVTGVPSSQVMAKGMLGASAPSPTIAVDEGDELYVTLTNVGMMMRPDLFDPHSVHFHGFPQAAPVFDGVPESSISINMGSSVTYYYRIVEPGTYMYHCHVEATEHMQMGMLGNLYVRPKQNKLPQNTVLAGGFVHKNGNLYAYNDGDGSTRYDVDLPIQITSMDPAFHDASESVQPLPFAAMRDRYPLLNGRGYPDTVNPGALPAPMKNMSMVSQPVTSYVTAKQGQRILLRISNLTVTRFFTLGTTGVPMQVVGQSARLLRGPSPDGVAPGKNLYYTTTSLTLGGGESVDAIVDTSALAPGTYFIYSRNLSDLANNLDDLGGLMTELVVQP